MKKKKLAFTLIELLAVIIVLAIIALIAVPIIFNLIENAKIKSLENSCYGVIDAVKTNYAENLLNSEDGTVILKGNVKDLTLSGEHPIKGTWEIDNSSNSTDRGIKIKNVKFASMIDYTCTNVNSDGTINSKVMCTKDGEKSNEIVIGNISNNELSYYGEETIVDYDIDEDKCVEFVMSDELVVSELNFSQDDANYFCKGDGKEELIQTVFQVINSSDEESNEVISRAIESGALEPTYVKTKTSCFEYPIKSITVNFDYDNCITTFTKFYSGYASGEEIENICSEVKNAIEADLEETDLSEVTFEDMIDTLNSPEYMIFHYHDVITYDIEFDKTTITGYLCGVGNTNNAPEITDVVIPKETVVISNTSIDAVEEENGAFFQEGLTSVDFSQAVNLEKIEGFAFKDNQISTVDLSGLTKLKIIAWSAFTNNQITSLDLSGATSLETIQYYAFEDNQISSINLSNLPSLTAINIRAFDNNQISNVNLCGMPNLKTLSGFGNNQISSINLNCLTKLEEIELRAFDDNQINELDLSGLTSLKTLSGFHNNQIKEFDFNALSKTVTEIGMMAFSGNQLSSVDLSGMTNLKLINQVAFSNNQISSINLNGLQNLEAIKPNAFGYNQISTLNLNDLPKLTTLSGFQGNQISSLDLSNLSSLTTIENYAFEDNQISSLNLNGLTKLKTIWGKSFKGNPIGNLDLSNLSSLNTIYDYAFEKSKITSIKIPNSVTTIGEFAFDLALDLTSIEIDNYEGAISGSPWGAENATITYLR